MQSRINEFARMILIAAIIAIVFSALRIIIFENGNFSAYLPNFQQVQTRQTQANNTNRTQDQNVQRQVHSNNPKVNSSDSVIDIPIRPQICLNGMSKNTVLNYRKRAMQNSPLFSDMQYEPSASVFNNQDGFPWISINGALHFQKYSPEERIQGPSRESIGILNPELLYYISIAENEDAISNDFRPLYKDFDFVPHKVVYSKETNTITAYIKNERLENGIYQPIFLSDSNAHDLGYKYAYMNKSRNVGFYKDYKDNTLKSDIKELNGYYMLGSACGLQGGCNNYAPYWQYYNYLYLKTLPASFNIKLWKNRPHNVEQEADINFTMMFL